MKLSVRGGRVEGNRVFLSAAAAGRSLCAIRSADRAVHAGSLILSLLLVALTARAVLADSIHKIAYPSVGGISLCQPLAFVARLFPRAKATTVSSEGSMWPAVRVDLGKGTWLLFESSHVDPARIWRISTNDSGYSTRRGYRVGTSIAELLRKGEKLGFSYPEGYLVVEIVSENVGTLVDDESARRFWARFDYSGDPLKALDHTAQIKELGIAGNCHAPSR